MLRVTGQIENEMLFSNLNNNFYITDFLGKDNSKIYLVHKENCVYEMNFNICVVTVEKQGLQVELKMT